MVGTWGVFLFGILQGWHGRLLHLMSSDLWCGLQAVVFVEV
jgi:hypothetical protein